MSRFRNGKETALGNWKAKEACKVETEIHDGIHMNVENFGTRKKLGYEKSLLSGRLISDQELNSYSKERYLTFALY